MGRWEPNARGRLARAALEISAERGYDATTVADIASAAGVTERTFYRYFADKADAMFPDNTALLTGLRGLVEERVRSGATPLAATFAAVGELATYVAQEPARARLMAVVVPGVPVLAGRDLVRQREMSDALSSALTAAGVTALESRLAAETALAVWRVALEEWRANDQSSLADLLARSEAGARSLHDA